MSEQTTKLEPTPEVIEGKPVRRPLAYVAGPYRDARGTWYVEQNIRRAEAIAIALWQGGFAVICPHLNTRHFCGAAPDNVWLDGDLVMVERCDLLVLTADWKKSVGARKELEHACAHGIPIYYCDHATPTADDGRRLLRDYFAEHGTDDEDDVDYGAEAIRNELDDAHKVFDRYGYGDDDMSLAERIEAMRRYLCEPLTRAHQALDALGVGKGGGIAQRIEEFARRPPADTINTQRREEALRAELRRLAEKLASTIIERDQARAKIKAATENLIASLRHSAVILNNGNEPTELRGKDAKTNEPTKAA